MNEAIIEVQKQIADNKVRFEKLKTCTQKVDRAERNNKEIQRQNQPRPLYKSYKILCANCRNEITTSLDMRQIPKGHYVSINMDVINNVEMKEVP